MGDIVSTENPATVLPTRDTPLVYKTDPLELAKSLEPTRMAWQGSNPGAIYRREVDGQNEIWYVKFCDENKPSYLKEFQEDHLRAEFIATRIYHQLGFNVPEIHLVHLNNKLALAKKEIPNVEKGKYGDKFKRFAKSDEVKIGFLVDVYLNNWDVTTNFCFSNGEVYRVDSGGALNYRAKGGSKEFGDRLEEKALNNFCDINVNSCGPHIYADVQPSDLKKGAEKIASLSNEEIAEIVIAAGYDSKKREKAAISKLIRRREDIKNIYGLNTHKEISERSVEDDEIWKKLEEKLPGNGKLNYALDKVREFEKGTMQPWIDISFKNIEDRFALLQSPTRNSREEIKDFEDRLTKVKDLENKINFIRQQLLLGQIPQLENSEKRSLAENLRLKVDKTFREKEIQKIKEYCEKVNNEIKTTVATGFEEMQDSTRILLAQASEETEYLSSLKVSGDNNNIFTPEKVLKNIQKWENAKKSLERWKNYSTVMGDKRIAEEMHSELLSTETAISEGVDKFLQIWKKQIISVGNTCFSYRDDINADIEKHEGYSDGKLAKFINTPSIDQENEIIGFYNNTILFLEEYKEVLTDVYKKKDLFEKEEVGSNLRTELRQKCEEIRKDVVCHLTLTNDEYIKKILIGGYLISSKGQLHLNGEANINSPAGKRTLLSYISFSVNGAELQYGGVSDSVENTPFYSGAPVKSSKESNTQRGYNGVGFVFPYVSAIKGQQFLEAMSSQGLGEEHYDEVRVFNPLFNGRDDFVSADLVTKIGIDEGVFIVPESQKTYWIDFLQKSKNEGGAGYGKEWVDKHLRAYPDYSTPRDFVEMPDVFGGLSFPKAEPGILIPTGNKTETMMPLFKWVTL